jgi:hypothetical protein
MAFTPLNPRQFFAKPWSGRGSFRLFGSRWVRGFQFRSECQFITEREWIVKDTTTFDDGRMTQRIMRARFVPPDRIAVSAEDLPRGAEMTLEEHGFHFRPYLLRIQIGGPLGVRVRCRDRCWLDEKGKLNDELELRFFGLPLGQVTMSLAPGEP